MPLYVDKYICPQNHRCPSINVCPVGAITQKGIELPVIDNEKCIKCKKCILYCPLGAIKITT